AGGDRPPACATRARLRLAHRDRPVVGLPTPRRPARPAHGGMMSTDLARIDPSDVTAPDVDDSRSALAHYLGTGDLSKLVPEQRAALYLEVCRSLAINPRTRPLDWIEFYDPETKGKKLVLYPNKTCTDQLAYL